LIIHINSPNFLQNFEVFKFSAADSPSPCAAREYGLGRRVCVCNATYCDGVPDVLGDRLEPGQARLITSSRAGARFAQKIINFAVPEDTDTSIIFII
jgi:hypothetical protein